MLIKDMPFNSRPRERLIRDGVESLSNEELLAIILNTGTRNYSVKDIALELLKVVDNINDFKKININTLMNIKGIGLAKAIKLVAVIEFGKRIYLNNEIINKKSYCNAKSIFLATKYLFHDKKQEYFYCLYFNNKQELLERKLLFMGTVNKSIVHPREVFKEAYLLSATSVICMHNHPSGDVIPSQEDIILTRNLVKIGKIQNIPIIDHIIVSDNDYYSFYENGDLANL